MTDAWDSLPGAKKKAPGSAGGEETLGSFECQTCYAYVEQATYFPQQKIMQWVCGEGHRSQIEWSH